MLVVRAASAADEPFLRRMLAAAADWRPGVEPRAVDDVMADPGVAHYLTGWPRDGDFGVVAVEDGVACGAAWCRSFDAGDPGYGFVAPDVPELAIGVEEGRRGRGVGRRLLLAVVEAARARGIARISLSVERENPAIRLYADVGFAEVGEAGGSVTMVLDVDGSQA